MPDWYDGPRGGIANFKGRPHAYASLFDEAQGYSDTFLLMPIDEELFQLALEDWGIWLRWNEAFHAGKAPIETHPALPKERSRHEELNALIADRLRPLPGNSQRAHAEFRHSSIQGSEVRWTAIIT